MVEWQSGLFYYKLFLEFSRFKSLPCSSLWLTGLFTATAEKRGEQVKWTGEDCI